MHKIKQIELNKLFGYEKNNYTVNLLDDSPLTFIYAFNGIGKTTLFKLIDAAIKRKMTVLDSIIFESLRITFDTNETLTVKKLFLKHFDDITMGELPNDENKYYFPIIYNWETPEKDVIVGKHYFHDKRSEEIKALLDENYELYSRLPYSWKTDKGIQKIPLNLFYKKPIVDEFIDSREIENNLLYVGVDLLFANKDYGRIQINDDARFDYKTSIFQNYPSKDYIFLDFDKLNELVKTRNSIAHGEYSSWKSLSNFLDYEEESKTLRLDLDDKTDYIENKIKYYLFNEEYKNKLLLKATIDNIKPEEIIEKRFNLFEEIINKKACLTDKKINVNRKTGNLEIKFDYNDDIFLTTNKLSSGEKNLLLLYFHLIFLVPDSYPEKGTYIQLIDEPEVSMHPDWLISFIENLDFINNELGRGNNFQFILATHSPAITYANSNLMVEMRRD